MLEVGVITYAQAAGQIWQMPILIKGVRQRVTHEFVASLASSIVLALLDHLLRFKAGLLLECVCLDRLGF
jgi:hypothetical protein